MDSEWAVLVKERSQEENLFRRAEVTISAVLELSTPRKPQQNKNPTDYLCASNIDRKKGNWSVVGWNVLVDTFVVGIL